MKWLVQSGKYREPWISQLRELTKHPNLIVRQAAFLAFSEIGPELNPMNPLVEEFGKVMDDDQETAAIREAALMAFASFGHPRVFVRLHEMALETNHPAWRAAISNLESIGNEFTIEHLKLIDKSKLSAKDGRVYDSVQGGLKSWADDNNRQRVISLAIAVRYLERVTWAGSVKSPLQKQLAAWTKAFFATQPDQAFESHLKTIRDQYTLRFAVPDPLAFQRWFAIWRGRCLRASRVGDG